MNAPQSTAVLAPTVKLLQQLIGHYCLGAAAAVR